MDVELYVKIIKDALLPFMKEKFPVSHHFMQDNDPKHTSGCAKISSKTIRLNGGKLQPSP